MKVTEVMSLELPLQLQQDQTVMTSTSVGTFSPLLLMVQVKCAEITTVLVLQPPEL